MCSTEGFTEALTEFNWFHKSVLIGLTKLSVGSCQFEPGCARFYEAFDQIEVAISNKAP